MCVTDRNDMTLAVKETLNPNTINQQIRYSMDRSPKGGQMVK